MVFGKPSRWLIHDAQPMTISETIIDAALWPTSQGSPFDTNSENHVPRVCHGLTGLAAKMVKLDRHVFLIGLSPSQGCPFETKSKNQIQFF